MIFTPAELAVLRASDQVVDQLEPGGVLYRRDRAYRRPRHRSKPRPNPRTRP